MAKILLLFITLLFVGVTPTPTSYTLERAFPVKHDIPISKLRERDIIRHGRLLQQSGGGDVFDFPLEGDSDPYHIGIIYYTKVQLGTPPRDYHVQIDTGSNVLWVNCKSCNGCPTSSRLHIPVEFYDSSSSSTSSLITCSDSLCTQARRYSDSGCSQSNNRCTYRAEFMDGSLTSGYYVSNLMHLNTMGVVPDHQILQPKLYSGGYTASETGNIRTYGVNGIFGFSQHSMQDYQVNFQSISVNGQTLSIDPSTFSYAVNQTGTVIDSRTTLAFLPLNLTSGFTVCTAHYFKGRWVLYIQLEIVLSVSSKFPLVSLNFQGGSSMHIRPQDYLLQDNSKGGAWCLGFQQTHGITILGDLVLKDKIIVYDLGGQRLGWFDYNCKFSSLSAICYRVMQKYQSEEPVYLNIKN
ncbi:Aspartic peptidase [Artemisia annua]|uniref:Aspartic peptidase n=1 Tax=Artemisia annua TaxID=35608 RepID=A0A2U1LNN6_ARTAN|nr:Aspartic peptidase [Artemisia annua]